MPMVAAILYPKHYADIFLLNFNLCDADMEM